MRLEVVERHLAGGSSLIAEACVLPGPRGLDGCVVVVAPNAAALSAQRVPMALSRIREVVEVAASTAPEVVRIDDLVLLEGPLPRTAQGSLARDVIAERARTQAGGDAARAEVDHPAARRLLERLQAILRLPGPCTPAQHFARDLGLDSLDLVQVRLLLEEEFGVAIGDEELWRVQTVADAIERVVAVSSPPSGSPRAVEYTWAARLREPPAVPLDRRFNMDRRGVNHVVAELGMRAVDFLSRLAFRIELVHGERLPRSGPYLLCPTHQSLLDSPLMYGVFPSALIHRTVFIAHGPYFRSAPLSWLVKLGRLILTGESDSIADSLRLGWEGLQRGWVVVIFPEGNCSYTGEVMAGRPGVGLLACEAQVPVVPVLFQGSKGTFSPLHPGFRTPKIRVVVGEPIQPPVGTAFSRADYQAVADRWAEAARQLAKGS